MSTRHTSSNGLVGFPEIARLTGGKSKMTIWRWENQGRFPRRIRFGENSVGWLRSEVDAWLAACIEKRDQPAKRVGRQAPVRMTQPPCIHKR
jgi:prophage regulatory protein